MDLFPAIDLFEGKVVRLHQGRYDAVTVYDRDPVARAGAPEIARKRGGSARRAARKRGGNAIRRSGVGRK